MAGINPIKADPKNNTLSSFLTSLAINGTLFILQITAFVALKRNVPLYTARSCSPQEARQLEYGLWNWLIQTWKASKEDIIQTNGLDAYLSIRFLRMTAIIFGVFTLITWPILVPINITGTIIQSDGLGKLGFGNINRTQQSRYWAHLVVALILTAFVVGYVYWELYFIVILRQDFLLSRMRTRPNAYPPHFRAVLITALPLDRANEEDTRNLFSFVPGGIERIWLYKSQKRLVETYNRRNVLCMRLESIITTYLKQIVRTRGSRPDTKGHSIAPMQSANMACKRDIRSEDGLDDMTTNVCAQRPKHRIGDRSSPLSRAVAWLCGGERTDKIEYLVEQIQKSNADIDILRKDLEQSKAYGSCVVLCRTQIGAQVLAQCVSYRDPLFMNQRWVGVSPGDMVWENIDDGPYSLRIRYLLSWAGTLVLLILWVFPVAVIGFTSNISEACKGHWWLAWICNTPPLAQDVIQAALPPVILEVCLQVLPYLLKSLAKFEDLPRYSRISLAVYKRYFVFLFVHGFLVVSVFAGLSQVLEDLEDPKKTVQNFSVYLPNTSNFFLTYMMQQGLAGSAANLLQIRSATSLYLKEICAVHTPRRVASAKSLALNVDFGIVLPKMSLLATIGLAFSVISPIMNLVAGVIFSLLWFSWKYLFTWVLDQPVERETGGLYFPQLMSNLWLYVQQLCLSGLFFFAVDDNGNHSSTPQGFITILLIILTLISQVTLRKFFDPVISNLPISNFQSHKLLGDNACLPLLHMRSISRTNENFLEKCISEHTSDSINQEERLQEEKRRAHKEASLLYYTRAGAAAKKAEKVVSYTQSALHGGTPVPTQEDQGQPCPNSSTEAALALSGEENPGWSRHAFDHPSSYVPQRWIWIPRIDDPALAVYSEDLVAELLDKNVAASNEGATMDSKLKTRVTGDPPGPSSPW